MTSWNYQFENGELLWLLLLLPLIWFYQYWQHQRRNASLLFPETSFLARETAYQGNWWAALPYLLRSLSIGLVIIGLARPRTSEEVAKNRSSEGIDIVMAVDVSASMLAQDLKPNRLEATKEVASDFIAGRPTDRIGLVVYAGESYTQTPLTTDHKILKSSLRELEHGLIEDGTAIGMGLATMVSRLKDSKAKSKVAILLTDGENNSGEIDPLTAAQLAEEFRIRVYTIGVGTKGTARTPVAYDGRGGFRYANMPVNIDEELLQQIAEQTGGQYFRATDNEKLKAIYAEIDQLEKTKLQELKFYSYDEKFTHFVLLALLLFSAELILRYTWQKSFV
jgi:Ca-activated chloride channel family protein